jgi:O-glycosyl hydrolase
MWYPRTVRMALVFALVGVAASAAGVALAGTREQAGARGRAKLARYAATSRAAPAAQRAKGRAPDASTPVDVSATPAQRISGFGASGDWWTTDLGYFPRSTQRNVAALLFGAKGIELSHYRYNIGGGGVGADVPTGDESELSFQTRAPASMYVAPGIYNWAHNGGGTLFLRYAARYHVPAIEANVNSAPWSFTTNGKSCGGQLKTSAIGAYASYLAQVVRHAHDFWHATLSYVSPMNEPDYTRSDCTQEGMQVPPSERAQVVDAVANVLRRQAPYAHVIADESSQVGTQFLPEAPTWLSVPGTAQHLAALATHTYDFPSNATLQQAAALAARYHKPLWMTEICCVVGAENHPTYGQGYDPTMSGALSVAYLIWQDLTYGDMSTWDWWVSLSAALGCDPAKSATCATKPNASGYNDGLIYYDPNFAIDHDYKVYLTKRFWMLGNFSRFVRPGAVRHDVSGAPANVYLLAFSSPRGWELVAIDQNTSGSTPIAVRFPPGGRLRAAGAYQTSATRNLAPVAGARRGADGAFTATLPAQSVTTFVFRG